MTATPRRTIRVSDTLWVAFLRKHGPRGASERIRDMIIKDLKAERKSVGT